MADLILEALRAARRSRTPCAVATVAATAGSVPRQPGSKMLIYDSGKISGTIGGGKFESLVIGDSLAAIREKAPLLKRYALHEHDSESFGAICGGEVTVLIEPYVNTEALVLVGGGHCALAIAKLANECGMHVTVVDDRASLFDDFPKTVDAISKTSPPEFIAERKWTRDDALVLVSRNFEIDRDALAAALKNPGFGYVGMIGSVRKVRRVFDDLEASGHGCEALAKVYAPIGLDIGADSPAEIAISVLAEVLQVLRQRPGGNLRLAGQI